ncbi:hypothetical protein [Halorhabdus amylolytica]|uniref:hypothetical protein n=1 Tax=Halorhabdus amylolytica TaxID=2559573 RepID=UPI0010A9A8C0|nr:hypothetical protein [Halorhabdus amylolytica]
MRPRRGRSVAVGILLIVLLATVTLAAGRPPPQPLCEVCEDDVIEGSDVESATVTIEIDGDGVGHWTARLDLRANASIDPRAMQSAAEDALRGHRGEATPRDLSVTASGDTVVLTYDVPRMGHRSVGGVQVVDYFHSQGDSGRWYGVNADRIVVTGPEGTTLVRAPADYRLNGTALALEGAHGDSFERTISPGWYLAFAGDDGLFARAATHLGIGIDIAQLKGADLPGTVVLPTAILAAFLGMISRWGRSTTDRSPGTRLRSIAGVTVGLAIAGFLLAALVSWLTTGTFLLRGGALLFGLLLAVPLLGPLLALAALGVGTQYVVLSGRFDLDVETRWFVLYGIGIAGIALTVAPFAAGTIGRLSTLYGGGVCALVSTLFAPLALADRIRVRWLLAVTILVSPFLVSLGWAPYGNYGAIYVPMFTVVWALVAGTLGAIAYTFARPWRGSGERTPLSRTL